MPKLLLTRIKVAKHLRPKWRVVHKGQAYYFRGTYQEAKAAWETTLKELQHDAQLERALQIASEDIEIAQRVGSVRAETNARTRLAQLVDGNRTEVERLADPFLEPPRQSLSVIRGNFFESLDPEQEDRGERFDFLNAIIEAALTPKKAVNNQSIKTLVEQFLSKIKDQKVNVGETGIARLKKMRTHLGYLIRYFGEKTSVKSLTTESIDNFKSHLGTLVKSDANPDGRLKKSYLREILKTTTQFTRGLARVKTIDAVDVINFKRDDPLVEPAPRNELFDALHSLPAPWDLWLCLMINCGYTQKDLNDLKHSEVDWQNRRIKRKRSKTGKSEKVPVVDYPLWRRTFELLKANRSDHPEAVLLWQGKRLLHGYDRVCDMWNSVRGYTKKTKKGTKYDWTLSQIRSLGATLIDGSDFGVRYSRRYLGHAPNSIADSHYILFTPELHQPRFDEAIKWLGEQFGGE